ncbi:MAG TPA: RluA family pseudouridine synthase [Solirubrobacteraceae bacterium]|nr:RluA family pseudouridine synthase [Solirubrobacteraceae bacterium]
MRREVEVPPGAAGQRLDVFLAESFGSRSAAQRLIEGGHVRVDGQPRTKRHRLSGGERIQVDESDPRPPPRAEDAPVDVAWEDASLLVVDKPAGVVVHPAKGHATGTLAQALAGRAAGGADPWRAGLVHRLDRDTSGLLVVAKDEATHRALKEMLQARRIVREYLALVEGRPPARSGTIDAPLGRDRRERTKVSIQTDDPRGAVTHFEIERALAHDTLLRVRLETGRTHQIRAHLQAIGHPVAGDPQYGHSGRHGLRRQFLHATRLAFEHPVTREPVDVVSPLPQDLADALRRAAEAP